MLAVVRGWACCALFVVLAGSVLPAAAQGGSCDELRTTRDRLKSDYDKLASYKLPDEQAADIQAALAGLRTLLADTSSGAADWSKRIGDYVEKVKKTNPSNPQLAKLVDKVSDIGGKIGKGVGDVGEKMGKLNDVLGKFDDVLTQFQDHFKISETGSAADQLRDFQKVFDQVRGLVPGIDEIPGISELFDVYSKAIGAIADSTAQIEAEVKRRNQEAASATDSNEPLYMTIQSQRGLLADKRRKLGAQLASLNDQMDSAGCNGEPPAPPATRAETADRVCNRMCEGQSYDWRTLSGIAQDAEQKASDAEATDKSAGDHLDALKAKLAADQARLAKVNAAIDDLRASYQGVALQTVQPRLDELQSARDQLSQGIGQDQPMVDRVAASTAAQVKATASLRARATAARAAADKGKSGYDSCRSGCYDNALKSGDIDHLPDDVAPLGSDGGSACPPGTSLAGAVNNITCQMQR